MMNQRHKTGGTGNRFSIPGQGEHTSHPMESSVITVQTPLMLHVGPPHEGSFSCIGRETTPSPANRTLASLSSRADMLQKLKMLIMQRHGEAQTDGSLALLLLAIAHQARVSCRIVSACSIKARTYFVTLEWAHTTRRIALELQRWAIGVNSTATRQPPFSDQSHKSHRFQMGPVCEHHLSELQLTDGWTCAKIIRHGGDPPLSGRQRGTLKNTPCSAKRS